MQARQARDTAAGTAQHAADRAAEVRDTAAGAAAGAAGAAQDRATGAGEWIREKARSSSALLLRPSAASGGPYAPRFQRHRRNVALFSFLHRCTTSRRLSSARRTT